MGGTWVSVFLHDATRVERRRFDLLTGVVAAVLVIVPRVMGRAVGTPNGGVFATLGAPNLLLATAASPRATRFPPLAVAAFSNASAFALGTIAGTTLWWRADRVEHRGPPVVATPT